MEVQRKEGGPATHPSERSNGVRVLGPGEEREAGSETVDGKRQRSRLPVDLEALKVLRGLD